MDIIRLILTALLSVAVLFVTTKLMGHKQVAQLDFFDYVSGITVGSIGAELATELEQPQRPLIALLVWCGVALSLNLLAHKLPRSRKYVNGTPTILMTGGKIYRENLKKAKLDLSEFLMLCREQGYFDLRDVQTAVFEQNGQLSVLPRSAHRPATPEDLGIPTRASHIGTELIMDGQIMGENLTRIGCNELWLSERLAQSGHKSAKEILLAVYRAEEDELTLYTND